MENLIAIIGLSAIANYYLLYKKNKVIGSFFFLLIAVSTWLIPNVIVVSMIITAIALANLIFEVLE